jgi:hypothetical protein
VLLRRSLRDRIGSTGLPSGLLPRLWAAAGLGAIVGWLAIELLPAMHPVPMAVLALGGYGVTYIAAARLLGVSEARTLLPR